MCRYSEADKAKVRRRMSPLARQSVAQFSKELCIPITILQRWQRQFVGEGNGTDRRKGSQR